MQELKSGLQLEEISRSFVKPKERSRKHREIEEIEVREVAQFGLPSPGAFGALKYWFVVHKRLGELVAEYKQAEESQRLAIEAMINQKAALGRKAQALGVKGKALDSLISNALRAQGELTGVRKQRSSLEEEHRAKISAFDEEIQKAEAETAPFRAQELELQRKRSKITTDRRREEARLTRVEIELRNLDSLIQKRNEFHAAQNTSSEVRQAVFTEISRLEARRPGLLGQIQAQQEQLALYDEPLAQVEGELVEMQNQLARRNEKVESTKRERADFEAAYAQRDMAVAKQVDVESQKVNLAWAEVGEELLRNNPSVAALDPLRAQAMSTHESAEQSKRQADLLLRAQQSYDHNTVGKAKRVAAVLIGIALALGGAVIYFLT